MAHLPGRRAATRSLVLAWCGYWLALAVAALGRPALLAWRLTHDAGRHGSVTVNATNDVVALTVTEHGATAWAGRASFLTIALWLVVPPLVLFVVLLVTWRRGRPGRAADARLDHDDGARPVLGGGRAFGAGADRAPSERVRPE